MLKFGRYCLQRPDEIETPAMVVFQAELEHNIRSAIEVCGSAERLVPHFKTHKSAAVLAQTLAAGIKSYKCATLREAEVLADAGVSEIIVAYPIVHPMKVERMVALMQRHTDLDLRSIVSTPFHVQLLSRAAVAHGIPMRVYVDLDTGMHRTGVAPGVDSVQLYREAHNASDIQVVGFHVFDGHTALCTDRNERQALVDQSYRDLTEVWSRVQEEGCEVIDNIVGNSWSFHLYPKERKVRVSPGTWIYWDHRNARMTELPFRVAGMVLGQIIDSDPLRDTVTLDIGSKSISDDVALLDRLKILGHETMELTAQSEEHGVLKCNGAKFRVGDFVLAVPGHACTMTAQYPYAWVVDEKGQLVGRYDHQAQNH